MNQMAVLLLNLAKPWPICSDRSGWRYCPCKGPRQHSSTPWWYQDG